MNPLAPGRATRWIIAIVVGLFFLIPFAATFLFTLKDGDGYSATHWTALFDPERSRQLAPVWRALENSLVLVLVTVLIVLVLFAPTIILVNLRFPRLRRFFEFVALLPISIPAIVLVVGLSPIYMQVARTLGTGTWTLAFAYGVTVLPFAYRSIQASADAVDMKTLAEAARSLGAGWFTVVVRVLAPNLRQGLLSASLVSVAAVLGEFTIASLLNRQVLQTALVVVQKQDPYSPAIFALLALGFAFVLLLVIGSIGSRGGSGAGKRRSRALRKETT